MTREEQKAFDRENQELNWIKPGIYKDLTEKPEPEAEIPDEYREKAIVKAAKIAGLIALSCAFASLMGPLIAKYHCRNLIVYCGAAAWLCLIGSLARK